MLPSLCVLCAVLCASGGMIVSYWDSDASLWLNSIADANVAVSPLFARSLPNCLFVHLCFPFALAYLDVSFFYHILFRLGNFFYFGWCDVVQLMLTCEQFTRCLEFSRFISLTFILFASFLSLSQCETSRSPFHMPHTVHVCMIFPSFIASRTLMASTFIYIHHVDFVVITTILFVSNFYGLTTAISFFLSFARFLSLYVYVRMCAFTPAALCLCLPSSVVHYRHEKLLNTTFRCWIRREREIYYE